MRANRLLVVTAVAAERDAALRGLSGADREVTDRVLSYELRRVPTRAGETTFVAGGVGPAAAAACTAALLALDGPYDAVVAAGVAGGFTGHAEPGSVVVADRVVLADLGADSPEGFLPLDELGLGQVAVDLPAEHVRWAVDRVSAGSVAGPVVGTVVTVSTVTGTDERATALAARLDAAAEAMEGGGVLCATRPHEVPFVELRTISNAVGRRDRSRWRLPEALSALSAAVAALVDEPVVP